ncbi:MAG: outer membrane protein transport protein, partial [Candidatus Heimdallarchaeota archaeon]|nr:outer membrane protein transport protein [Candidatus Heimdallarchaeota archaeon]
NVYYGMLELKRGEDKINILEAYGVPEDGMLDTQTAFDIAGLGYGATIGLMYKMSDIVSLGITYRTPINVAFEGDADIDLPGLDTVDGSIDIEWPMWLGAGLAVKANDKLTLTCDAQYSQWSSLEELDAEIKLPAAYGGTTIQKMHLEWEDATQIRLGLAYELNENLTVLHGWYFDPGPSPDETLTILFPSQTYSVVTGGLCYKINNFDVDFGIEYLFGVDRNIKAAEHNMPGVHQMDIFAVSLGLGYSF